MPSPQPKIRREKIPGGLIYPATEELLQEFAAHIGMEGTVNLSPVSSDSLDEN